MLNSYSSSSAGTGGSAFELAKTVALAWWAGDRADAVDANEASAATGGSHDRTPSKGTLAERMTRQPDIEYSQDMLQLMQIEHSRQPRAVPSRPGTAVEFAPVGVEVGGADTSPSQALLLDRKLVARRPLLQVVQYYSVLLRSHILGMLPERERILDDWTRMAVSAVRAAKGDQRARRLESAFNAIRKSEPLLALRLNEALDALWHDRTAERLSAAGVSVDQVRARLYEVATDFLRQFESQAASGIDTLPFVPTHESLLGLAIASAKKNPPATGTTASTSTTATASTSTTAPFTGSSAEPHGATAGIDTTDIDTATPATAATAATAPASTHAATTTTLASTTKKTTVVIPDRATAMAAIRELGLNRHARLPQFNSPNECAALSNGIVNVQNLKFLLATFPAATAIRPVHPGYWFPPDHPDAAMSNVHATYPSERPGHANVRRAYLHYKAVIIALTDDRKRIRHSFDGKTWVEHDIYTDADVEREKLKLWREIMRDAARRAMGALPILGYGPGNRPSPGAGAGD